MLKLVLIADTHLAARGEKVHTIDAAGRLDLCVRTIQEHVPDADLCVVMGDLVEYPNLAEYKTFIECMQPLKIPQRYLVGNHDDREVLLQAAPEIARDENGYIQSSLKTDDGVLLFLDTTKTGEHSGEYGPDKRPWLKDQLKEAGSAPVYIFMHHPPFATGFHNDASRLRDANEFYETLQTSKSIKHIFAGHMHRAASGTWRGYAWTSLHGTCYENNLVFAPAKPARMAGPAQIGVVFIDKGDVVLHFHDVLAPHPVVGYRT